MVQPCSCLKQFAFRRVSGCHEIKRDDFRVIACASVPVHQGSAAHPSLQAIDKLTGMMDI
jgi:hypothetical protein